MRIVIAEQDAFTRRLLDDFLKRMDHTVVVTQDGQELFDHLQHDLTFECVIMDYVMPRMNGFEVLTLLRTKVRFNKMPFIVCTALSEMRPKIEEQGGIFVNKANLFEDLLLAFESLPKSVAA